MTTAEQGYPVHNLSRGHMVPCIACVCYRLAADPNVLTCTLRPKSSASRTGWNLPSYPCTTAVTASCKLSASVWYLVTQNVHTWNSYICHKYMWMATWFALYHIQSHFWNTRQGSHPQMTDIVEAVTGILSKMVCWLLLQQQCQELLDFALWITYVGHKPVCGLHVACGWAP